MSEAASPPPNQPVPPAAPAPAPVPAAPDPFQLEILNILGPGAALESVGKLPSFRVASETIVEVCRQLRAAGFDYLILITAVDYPAENRFELNYVVTRFSQDKEFCVVTDIKREVARIETVSDIWAAADWQEREIYDMYGIRFDRHPDLRRILLDDTWQGYPLRKDYVDTVHDVIKRPY